MKAREFIDEDISRRGFLGGLAAGALGLAGYDKFRDKDRTSGPEIQPLPPSNAAPGTPQHLEQLLKNEAMKRGITGNELTQLLAQVAHETANFTSLVEKQSNEFLTKHYGKEGVWLVNSKGVSYKNPKNRSKVLGNTKPGDGPRFKGRGLIHLTGRYNYTKASEDLFGDDRLVRNPRLLEKPEIAVLTALWYWQKRVQPKVKDFGDVEAATRQINPGLKGLEARVQQYLKRKES